MLVLILAALVAATAWLAYVWQWQDRRWKLPPGPAPVPLFGNLLQLMSASFRGEAPFVTLSKWAFQYGRQGISYMRFGTQRVVVVSDAQLAQHMCVRMADNFSCRPSGLFVARVLKGKGIVCNDGPSWKAHRVFIQSEFRKFGFSRQSIEDPIQLVADELVEQLKKVDGVAHDPHMHLATATYNIIWNVISGTTFDWNDPFLSNLIRNLETNLDAMELVGAHNYVLFLTFVQLVRHNPFKLFKMFLERLFYFRKLISNHKTKMGPEADDSMISDYLEQIKRPLSPDEDNQLSESQLLFLVSDLFIAGGETTITTLRWAILCLAIHGETQDRIRQQIHETIGHDSPPSYTNRSQLPIMEAFIHEVLRFCGVTPGMWRNTSEDCVVGDYEIPKDTWVLLHFWAMSNQESTWADADRFLPERFLSPEGKFLKNDNLLAFSAGRRQCPGESLARNEIFILLGNIVQKFRITLAKDHDWEKLPDGRFGVTYCPPKFRVVFQQVAH